MPNSYTVEEITNAHDFLTLGEEWNKLVFEDPCSTIFQTWEWNFNTWKYNESGSRDLNILLVRDKRGSLVGIAPLCSYMKSIFGLGIRIIEFIGRTFSDYRDFIIKPGDDMQTCTEILNWLERNSGRWDIVDLQSLSDESHAIRNYNALLSGFSFRAVIQQHNLCPYVKLYANRNFYENLYNQSLVKYLKRKTRKLENELNYRFLTTSNSHELDEHLSKLFDLHKERRNQKLQLGIFNSEDQKQLFTNLSHDLLRRGCLKLFFLFVDDHPAACLYNFQFKNKMYFYQSGLDPEFSKYSLGYVIHSLAIQEALKNGMEEYDFLAGNEDYKKEWTENYRSLYRIKIVSSGFKRAVFNVNEKLQNSLYTSKFYKSKSIRRLYLSLKNLRKHYMHLIF